MQLRTEPAPKNFSDRFNRVTHSVLEVTADFSDFLIAEIMCFAISLAVTQVIEKASYFSSTILKFQGAI